MVTIKNSKGEFDLYLVVSFYDISRDNELLHIVGGVSGAGQNTSWNACRARKESST